MQRYVFPLLYNGQNASERVKDPDEKVEKLVETGEKRVFSLLFLCFLRKILEKMFLFASLELQGDHSLRITVSPQQKKATKSFLYVFHTIENIYTIWQLVVV